MLSFFLSCYILAYSPQNHPTSKKLATIMWLFRGYLIIISFLIFIILKYAGEKIITRPLNFLYPASKHFVPLLVYYLLSILQYQRSTQWNVYFFIHPWPGLPWTGGCRRPGHVTVQPHIKHFHLVVQGSSWIDSSDSSSHHLMIIFVDLKVSKS